MRKTRFPPGWNEERVRKVLEHYESQSEDETAFEGQTETVVKVPIELVPAVRELVAKRTA